jgi:hypothetical protein
MTADQMQSIADAYSSKFDNLDEVMHPSVMFKSGFLDLLENAVRSNQPLSREQVESVFGPISWEE